MESWSLNAILKPNPYKQVPLCVCAVFTELHVSECEWPKINAVKY
jgi:hypothetical protein